MSAKAQADFSIAMQTIGLIPDSIIADGELHRIKTNSDKHSKKSGWYIFYGDNIPAGSFGDWRTGATQTWCSRSSDTMSEAEKADYDQRIQAANAKRKTQEAENYAQAKTAVQSIWGKAKDATADNAYSQRKGIHPLGCKVFGDSDTLIVPIYDGKPSIDTLCNAQFIQADGTKRFKTGAKKKGCYTAIGKPESKTAVICEGFATGASIAQATNYYVIVAFDAGNLLPVAERIKGALPIDWRLIIAGDNDAFSETNTGADKARACAHAVGAECVIPDFTGCEITHAPTDFNDLHQLKGLEAVKTQIDGAGVLSTEQAQAVQVQAIEAETDEQTIERMAKLSVLDFARQSKAASDKLGITPSQLKQVVTEFKKAQEPTTDKPPLIETVEPWDKPVNGAEVLNEVLAQLQAHVIAPIETLHTASLWVCMTWLSDVATVLPVALITAPEKNCGKSTLLNAMAKMSKSALITSNMTSAVLFRLIDKHAPSLFIDEVDTFLRDNIELGGILNSGHTKDLAYVMRCEGDNFEPVRFSTWCPKALSGISASNISGTLSSRSIILTMRRKQAGESAQNIRHTAPETFIDIKRKLARWADDNAGAFSQLHPVIEGLNNREQDNYEPLLAIAMLAGGEWVQHLEHACNASRQNNEESKSIGVELLEACKQIFEINHVDKIRSTTLLEHLLKDDEAVFASYNRGKPMTIRQMAKRLGDYKIQPKLLRFGYENPARGYTLESFEEAFKTYLEGENVENIIFASATPYLSVTPLQTNTSAVLGVTDSVTCNTSKMLSVTPKATVYAGCNTVTDRKPQNDENLKSQPKSTYKSNFTNAVIEQEKLSEFAGQNQDELINQFEREFLKTGTDGGTS